MLQRTLDVWRFLDAAKLIQVSVDRSGEYIELNLRCVFFLIVAILKNNCYKYYNAVLQVFGQCCEYCFFFKRLVQNN